MQTARSCSSIWTSAIWRTLIRSCWRKVKTRVDEESSQSTVLLDTLGIENTYQLEKLTDDDIKSWMIKENERILLKVVNVVRKEKKDRENRVTLFGELR